MAVIVQIINLLAELLTLLVIAWTLLGFVLSPYHPVRQALDRIFEPLMSPIRRFIRPVGMFDFSPLVFIIVVQLIVYILNRLLLR